MTTAGVVMSGRRPIATDFGKLWFKDHNWSGVMRRD